jgi:acylphosphatase
VADKAPRLRRVHLVISGRVQNVFFRATLADYARELGLAGWVKNRPDGRVEAVLEGPAHDVERVVRWSHTGPPRARVDAIEATDEAPSGERGFSVL